MDLGPDCGYIESFSSDTAHSLMDIRRVLARRHVWYSSFQEVLIDVVGEGGGVIVRADCSSIGWPGTRVAGGELDA
jgi:hypothetical protein